jgi:hypothetical protein
VGDLIENVLKQNVLKAPNYFDPINVNKKKMKSHQNPTLSGSQFDHV